MSGLTLGLPMPVTCLVRPLVVGDKSAWLRLWTAYLDFYDTTLPGDVIETAWARLMATDAADFQGLVAQIEDEVVGLTHYCWHPHLWKPEGVIYLQDLYTDPTARRAGVGGALIEAVYRAADARGVPSVYWMTQSFNTSARALYDRVADETPFIKYARRAP